MQKRQRTQTSALERTSDSLKLTDGWSTRVNHLTNNSWASQELTKNTKELGARLEVLIVGIVL